MGDINDGPAAAGLAALHFWLFDFPQLEAYRQQTADDVADASSNLAQFDNPKIALKIREIAEEICDSKISLATAPTRASQIWGAIHGLLRQNELLPPYQEFEGAAMGYFETRACHYKVLCALLCHALSDGCPNQRDYVSRIMAIGRPEVQQEIMRMLQENNNNQNNGGDAVEDENETADYSVFMEASVLNMSNSFEYESDGDVVKRDRSEAFGEDGVDSDAERSQEKKRHHDTFVEDEANEHSTSKQRSANEKDFLDTITKLQQELKESRQQEMELASKADEEQAQHRAEMLQTESKYLTTIRDMEDKYTAEISEQKTELDMLRECKQSAKELKEENSRLRDDLDVLQCSKEKLSYTEEQLRKCREKIELIGDAHDALRREEKAHAASVDKCLSLENELANLKPIKRQLEECKVRATDAEVALAECREDFRRVKEKSCGLEGANKALERGANLQRAEAGNLQKRLQQDGGKDGKGGTAVGVGMSELNPELMEELKMLRSEYTRLKEFEAKREVDAVQRLEESCDDAKRLSDRYKEQFFQTKSDLEDTQQLLCESEAREAKLREEVAFWEKTYRELGDEMKEERLKSYKAALDAEREFQNEKKSLVDKGRWDLKCLEEKLTAKIEAERKQHKEKMDRAEARRIEIENNLSEQLTALREHTSKTLRSAKDNAEKLIEESEQFKKTAIENMQKEKEAEKEKLMAKGKEMIRESRRKNKELQRQIKEEYEVKINSLEEKLEKVKDFQAQYEKNVTTKMSKRDKQIKVLEARNSEAGRENDALEEKVKKAERNSKELGADVERLRRQLGSRFGSGGASQSQLEELTSMCKSLRDENHRLKENNPDRLLLARDVPQPSLGDSEPNQPMASLSKSSLTQFREEYEERIEELEDEKRGLIMKSSAATSETKKAEHRSWELEEELAKVKSELTTAKLALQRKERRSDFSPGLSASSKKRYERNEHITEKENTPNVRARGLPPSGMKRPDFTPKNVEPNPKKLKTNDEKSLMELTAKSNNNPAGANPECKQS